MSLALTHFALGAGGMLLLLAAFRPRCQYQQILVVASGVWALVPDLHYLFPTTDVFFTRIKFSIFGDLFWLHRTLDGLHQGRGTRGGAFVAILFLAVTAVIAGRREVQAKEKICSDDSTDS